MQRDLTDYEMRQQERFAKRALLVMFIAFLIYQILGHCAANGSPLFPKW